MVKTLTIRDDVYRKLVAIKSNGESFSELFERLVEKQALLEMFGRLRGSISFESTSEKEAFIREATAKRDEK